MSDTVHIVKCNLLNSIQHQEIGALKDRIIQLEEELIDAKGKYAALVADVVLYEDRGERIKRLEQTLEVVTDKLDNVWGIYMQFKEAK